MVQSNSYRLQHQGGENNKEKVAKRMPGLDWLQGNVTVSLLICPGRNINCEGKKTAFCLASRCLGEKEIAQ
jgi:hypothetical protein